MDKLAIHARDVSHPDPQCCTVLCIFPIRYGLFFIATIFTPPIQRRQISDHSSHTINTDCRPESVRNPAAFQRQAIMGQTARFESTVMSDESTSSVFSSLDRIEIPIMRHNSVCAIWSSPSCRAIAMGRANSL